LLSGTTAKVVPDFPIFRSATLSAAPALGRGKEVKVKHLPRIDSKFIVIALSVLVLLYFIVFPMLILIYDSFVVDGAINFSNYKAVYSQNVNWKALVNTVELSLLVMVASVIITFPMAWLIGRTDLPWKRTFRTILVGSYMIPPYVGAIAWVQMLNPSVGYLNELFKYVFHLSSAPFNIYTIGGLAWVLTLFYSPFAFITISRAMEKMDPTLEEAARVAGASPLRTLWDVTLPLMAPSIVAGGLLVFIAAGSAFGIPAIVGMPGNIEVMTTRIVTFVYMGDDKGIRDATALAVSLMLIANGLLFFMSWLLSRKDYTTISGKSTRPNMVELGKFKHLAFAIVAGYAFVAVILPIGSVVMTSFIKSMSQGAGADQLWHRALDTGYYQRPVHGKYRPLPGLRLSSLLVSVRSCLSLWPTCRLRPILPAAACRTCW
jgi:iron(III) transport system permease protein